MARQENESYMFSIIIPIYQVEKYLPECIESILRQICTDFEVILVDDGSQDRCPALCDAYARQDDRVKVIHKENGGLVSARKAGIQVAKGQYILNVDGDDHIAPTLLQDLRTIVLQYGPDMIAFNCIQTYPDGSERIMAHLLAPGFYSGSNMEKIWGRLLCDRGESRFNTGCLPPSICLKAVRRELLLPNQLAVPDQITNGEDTAVSVPTICQCKSVYASEITGYYYVQHAASMINTFRKDEIGKYQLLRDFLSDRIPEVPQENKDAYFFNLIVNQLSQAAAGKMLYSDFRRYAKKSIMENWGDMIARCVPWRMEKKARIRFSLLKNQRFAVLWMYYKIKNS